MNSKKDKIKQQLSESLDRADSIKEGARVNNVLGRFLEKPVEPAQSSTVAHHTTVALEATVEHDATVARQARERLHHATVESKTTVARHTTVAPYTIVETEYTSVPNDIWDNVMPTLDTYEQAIIWQLYRLSRGYHKETCQIGLDKLASRCNISKRQVSKSTDKLERRGLISRLGTDYGNPDKSKRGTIYRVNLPAARIAQRSTVARHTRVAQDSTVAQRSPIKEIHEKENTQTRAAVGVASKFTLEECRRYAEHLQKTGQGITNPGGYATTIYRTGEADALIESFLRPEQGSLDISRCPDCRGMNFVYVDENDFSKGMRPCKHDRLQS